MDLTKVTAIGVYTAGLAKAGISTSIISGWRNKQGMP
jgi:hypothetical protein